MSSYAYFHHTLPYLIISGVKFNFLLCANTSLPILHPLIIVNPSPILRVKVEGANGINLFYLLQLKDSSKISTLPRSNYTCKLPRIIRHGRIFIYSSISLVIYNLYITYISFLYHSELFFRQKSIHSLKTS